MVVFLQGEVTKFGVEETRSSSLVKHEWAETVVWVYC